MREQVGLAIVPAITIQQELREGVLARLALRDLAAPRRTLMIYREQGYVSASARALIKIVRAFDWGRVQPRIARGRARAAGVSQLRVVR
ncbi:MAG: hypothetical protein H0W08_12880 [Acidobacteria bacterium]|nr:hypothetical protein [Acidobacteriota bacterium]